MEDKLQKTGEIKTITDIVRHSKELPTIRQSDVLEVNEAVIRLILEVFEFYNESLSDIQTKLLVPIIREKVGGWALPDIDIFKKNCLTKKYKLKFRLTPDVFMDWINEYWHDRMEAFENLNLRAKKDIESQPISEKTVVKLKELGDKLKPKPMYEPKPDNEDTLFLKRVEAKLSQEFDKVKTVVQVGLKEIEVFKYLRSDGMEGFRDKREYISMRYRDICEVAAKGLDKEDKEFGEKFRFNISKMLGLQN